MTHAYSKSYLNSAKLRLAQYFDHTVNRCGLDADWAAKLFVTSGFAEQFERGNPAVVAGMSGIELARAVLETVYPLRDFGGYDVIYDSGAKSPQYWAGWALAEYQWLCGKRFKDIFEFAPLAKIVEMYPLYHEMDISHFAGYMNTLCEQHRITSDTKLRRLRESRGLSQAELSLESEVNLRSIQMYEQKVNDIDKAQAQTLYKLSRVLGCKIEDLLEDPMS